jgi:hypothetical protein
MVAGLLLLIVGALAVVAGVFTATGTDVELLGFDVGPVGLYLIGLGSGLAIMWGLGLTKWGTKRSLRHRREARKLNELSEKLERQEAERRDESDGERSL